MTLGKQKGIRFRKWFRGYLLYGATILFANEEAEYGYIKKFHHGLPWDKDILQKTFNAKELDIITELASAYGAFDY